MANGELGAMFEGASKEMGEAAEQATRSIGEFMETTAAKADSSVDGVLRVEEKATGDFAGLGGTATNAESVGGGRIAQILGGGDTPAATSAGAHQISLFGDAATGDVSTAPGEAVFWSGATKLGSAEAPWPGAIVRDDGLILAGEDNAKAIARSQGKTTLEGLMEDRGIELPSWSDDPAIQQQWKDVSDRYAGGVSGDVKVVLGDSLRPGNIWENVELPRLQANPAVSSITKINLETLEETGIWQRGGTG